MAVGKLLSLTQVVFMSEPGQTNAKEPDVIASIKDAVAFNVGLVKPSPYEGGKGGIGEGEIQFHHLSQFIQPSCQ